jgi:hypothetical protein
MAHPIPTTGAPQEVQSVFTPQPCPTCGLAEPATTFAFHYASNGRAFRVCVGCAAKLPAKVAALEKRLAELESRLPPVAK